MRRGTALTAILIACAVPVWLARTGEDAPLPPPAPAQLGDVLMDREASQFNVPPVVFPHAVHRMMFRCDVCHDMPFRMKAGAQRITMKRIGDGRFCGTCHNGTTSWRPVNCLRCHSAGPPEWNPPLAELAEIPVPGPPLATRNLDPRLLLADFPHDAGGNVDWAEALRQELIDPWATIEGRPRARPVQPVEVVMRNTGDQPPVVFPHAVHGRWLDCRNCHPSLFARKGGEHRAVHVDMDRGESCGTCHGRVSFPLNRCERCHLPGAAAESRDRR